LASLWPKAQLVYLLLLWLYLVWLAGFATEGADSDFYFDSDFGSGFGFDLGREALVMGPLRTLPFLQPVLITT
jgi:hypothetical protein